MNAVQKNALLAISSAATALAASAQALAASFEEPTPEPVAAPKPPKAAKPPPAAAPAAAPPAAAPPAAAPAPAANGEDIQAQCRKAAKSYAEVYGREGLKEVLSKFTTGTLADVPADKLPELLKALS